MDKNTVYWGNALKNPKYNKPKADTESLKVDGINDEVPLGQTMSGLDSSLESAAHADRLNRLHARQGHGYAAEQANDGIDTLFGRNARILGDDNAKNGADRMVDGQFIQTKYCQDARTSVNAGFENRGQGSYRYLDKNGNPMQLEVPSDQYDEAVRCMEQKIKEGKVPGVSDPKRAKDLIRKGHVTYAQAKAIAKAGTIESLTFDAAHGVVIGASALGISATITFAQAIWNGESVEKAVEQALIAGLQAGGAGFLIAVGTAQMARTGVNQVLMTPSIALVKVLPPPVRQALVNLLRTGAPIYGEAATRNLAKLMRSNVIASTVTIVVLSSGNIINYFRGRISAAQLMAEVSVLAAGIVGGYIGGAFLGALFGPLGAIAGGMIVGSLSSSAAQKLISEFHESDAEKMIEILQDSLQQLAPGYLLNQEEGLLVVEELRKLLNAEVLLCMFASKDQKLFADTLVEEAIHRVICCRAPISVPKCDEFTNGLARVFGSTSLEETKKAIPDDSEEGRITKQLSDMANGKGEKLSNEETRRLYSRLKALYAKRQSHIIGVQGESCLVQMNNEEVTYAKREKLINDSLQRIGEKLGEGRMKRQCSLIQKSNDLEEYKTELAVCIEQKITAYRNDTKKIDELTFQCISALAEVDNAKAELSSKGFLARFVGSITGSNHKLQNKINENQTLAQYALRETLMQLQKQNVITLDLIRAVNTKLNGLQIKLGQYGIYLENLVDQKKQQDRILINHERRLTKTEESIDLVQWGHTIRYQSLEGIDYKDLNQCQKLACLARDFFQKDNVTYEQDIATLKTAIDHLAINPDEIVSYYDTLKGIAVDDLARKKLWGKVNWQIYDSVDNVISFHTIGKICELQQANNPKIKIFCGIRNDITPEKACNQLVTAYIRRKDQCDVNTEVSFFDLVMDLVYNLRVLHEYMEENDLKLLNACK